MIHKLE
ncbi:hypothetical protein R3I93_004647 [Phoxinus phoxinus]